MVEVRGVGLRREWNRLAFDLDRAPIQGRRNLKSNIFLRGGGIVAYRNPSADPESLLGGFEPNIQVIFCDGERFAVEGQGGRGCSDKNAENVEKRHRELARLCRTISYKTTPAATETFKDGTFPSIGIETRKSHFLITRSCKPFPSAPK